MKLKKSVSLLLTVILVAGLLAGCGGSSAKSAYSENAAYESDYYYAGDAGDAEAPAAMPEEAFSEARASGSADASVKLPQGRKWIVTVSMDAETDDLDSLLTALNQKIGELEGYIENQDIRNGSRYSSGRRYRSANLTVRIPVEKLTDFTGTVQGLANVTTNSQNAQDVTLNYVDTESRLAALKIEEERLLALLGQAENMSDILEIESRLTDLRYEVERYGSKLRTMDNQIDFATIYLSLEEVREYTPVAEKTFLEKISEGFVDSLKDLGEGFTDFAAWLIISLPYLVVYAVVIIVIVLVSRRVIRKSRQRRMEKAQKAAAARYAQQQAAQAAQNTQAAAPKEEQPGK